MAKTVAAFYELPPWVEKMNQLQRQMDSLTRPLGEFQTDYAALTKTVAAALDSPAIRDLNRISRVFDSQSMAAIYRTQEIVAKMDTSGIAAALRQYQTVMDTIAPTDLQIQLNERLQEWSRIMSKATYRIEPLTETRIAELTRLSSLAEEYICVPDHDPHTRLYRIDRMADIRILDEPRSEKPAQKQEAQDAVYAFVGAPERVVLHCDRAVLDDVLDRFGTDIQIFERDEQTFTAVLTTPPRGVRFWALQYLSFVEVAEPAWLRQEIIESIGQNWYSTGER